MGVTKKALNGSLIMIGGVLMAKKDTKVVEKKSSKKIASKEVSNGAIILLCIFMLVIGFSIGWLLSFLV